MINAALRCKNILWFQLERPYKPNKAILLRVAGFVNFITVCFQGDKCQYAYGAAYEPKAWHQGRLLDLQERAGSLKENIHDYLC